MTSHTKRRSGRKNMTNILEGNAMTDTFAILVLFWTSVYSNPIAMTSQQVPAHQCEAFGRQFVAASRSRNYSFACLYPEGKTP